MRSGTAALAAGARRRRPRRALMIAVFFIVRGPLRFRRRAELQTWVNAWLANLARDVRHEHPLGGPADRRKRRGSRSEMGYFFAKTMFVALLALASRGAWSSAVGVALEAQDPADRDRRLCRRQGRLHAEDDRSDRHGAGGASSRRCWPSARSCCVGSGRSPGRGGWPRGSASGRSSDSSKPWRTAGTRRRPSSIAGLDDRAVSRGALLARHGRRMGDCARLRPHSLPHDSAGSDHGERRSAGREGDAAGSRGPRCADRAVQPPGAAGRDARRVRHRRHGHLFRSSTTFKESQRLTRAPGRGRVPEEVRGEPCRRACRRDRSRLPVCRATSSSWSRRRLTRSRSPTGSTRSVSA